MARFVTVTKADGIQPGQMIKVEIDNFPVAVANVGGTFYAFDDTCSHEDCSLAEGDLVKTAVVCPCHFAEFDVRNGAVLAPPATVPSRAFPAGARATAFQGGSGVGRWPSWRPACLIPGPP